MAGGGGAAWHGRGGAGTTVDGYEAIGALRFADVTLAPGESRAYVLILAVLADTTSRVEALVD